MQTRLFLLLLYGTYLLLFGLTGGNTWASGPNHVFIIIIISIQFNLVIHHPSLSHTCLPLLSF